MTVGEMIAELSKHPPDLEVIVLHVTNPLGLDGPVGEGLKTICVDFAEVVADFTENGDMKDTVQIECRSYVADDY